MPPRNTADAPATRDDRFGDRTAGARLGGRQRQPAPLQLGHDRAGQRDVVGAEVAAADAPPQLRRDRFDQRLGLLRAGRLGHQLDVDFAAVREHRDLGVLQRAEEVFDLLVELRLADPHGVQGTGVDRVAQTVGAHQPGHELLGEHRLHLARHARHAGHELAVRAQRDEAGRGAVRVGEHHAALRQIGLAAVVVGHRPAEVAETLLDRAQRRLVQHQRRADRARHRVLGQVVHRRPEAAGGDRAVGARQHVLQHRREPVGVVAHRVLGEHVDAVVGQHARDVHAVGVDQLAEQDLGADRDDLDRCHQNRPRAPRARLTTEPPRRGEAPARPARPRTTADSARAHRHRSRRRPRSSRGGGRRAPTWRRGRAASASPGSR